MDKNIYLKVSLMNVFSVILLFVVSYFFRYVDSEEFLPDFAYIIGLVLVIISSLLTIFITIVDYKVIPSNFKGISIIIRLLNCLISITMTILYIIIIL